jgi:hypothetical protein
MDQRPDVGCMQPVLAGELRAAQVEFHGDGSQQVHQAHRGALAGRGLVAGGQCRRVICHHPILHRCVR